MRKMLFSLGFILLFVYAAVSVQAATESWYYPIDHYQERLTLNAFGQEHTPEYYEGKEQFFRYHRFSGFHAADDLELLAGEEHKAVPVYAATNGTITFIGPVSGYGGVILEKISTNDHILLYGHVKIPGNLKVGQAVTAGQQLTTLGDAFSIETGQERKHLHFSIYKGTNQYFKGYEMSQSSIMDHWENPSQFLKDRNAQDLGTVIASPSPRATVSALPTSPDSPSHNIFSRFFHWLRNLISRR